MSEEDTTDWAGRGAFGVFGNRPELHGLVVDALRDARFAGIDPRLEEGGCEGADLARGGGGEVVHFACLCRGDDLFLW